MAITEYDTGKRDGIAFAHPRAKVGWVGEVMNSVFQHLHDGFRSFRRDATLTSVVVVTLAMGIGANTAVFNVTEAVLLRPLSLPDADKLVSVWQSQRNSEKAGSSGPEFEDFRAQNHSFKYLASVLPHFTYTWTGQGEPRTVNCTGVSVDFFSMLGLKPLLGRVYNPDEYHVDGVQVVISQRFWELQLGRDPHILGRVLNLDGTAQTVIGVMPAIPDLFPDTDVWAKVVPDFHWMHIRSNHFLTIMGLLKPGVTPAMAEEDLSGILRRGEGEPPNARVELESLKDTMVGKLRPQFVIAVAGAGLVLLITCINVAYLLLARNSKRQTDFAIRLSMGASQRRILGQMLAENLLLTTCGSVVGIAIAVAGVVAVKRLNFGDLPRLSSLNLGWQPILFTVVLTFSTALFLAWVSSMAVSRLNLNSFLGTGRGQASNTGRKRIRVLLISEVSFAVVLLVAAGLLERSFWLVQHSDAGFRPDHVLTCYLRTSDWASARTFFRDLLQDLPTTPEVRAAAVSDCLPGSGVHQATLTFNDRPVDPTNVSTVESCWISSDYFRALGVSLLQGRTFSEHDDENGAPVVIVNKALANRYWPGENPIGKRLSARYVGSGRSADSTETLREVVGVVANVRQKAIDSAAQSAVYMPFMQDATHHVFSGLNLFLWTRGQPAAMSHTVRGRIHAIAPNQPIDLIQTMEDSLFRRLARRRFVLTLITSFAGLALFLSAIGIYGMVAYSVGQRMREMGLRLALGSSRSGIINKIVGDTLILTVIGLAIGSALAGILSELMQSLLFGIRPADAVSFLASALILVGTAVLASLLPALRAAFIDPMLILRTE